MMKHKNTPRKRLAKTQLKILRNWKVQFTAL